MSIGRGKDELEIFEREKGMMDGDRTEERTNWEYAPSPFEAAPTKVRFACAGAQ